MNRLTKGKALFGDVSTLQVSYTIGTEATNAITVNVQVKDGNGGDLAERKALPYYLATNATGDTVATTAPNGGLAVGTDGQVIEWTANISGMYITESDGDCDIVITDSGTPTFYLVSVLPNGSLAVSDAITFA